MRSAANVLETLASEQPSTSKHIPVQSPAEIEYRLPELWDSRKLQLSKFRGVGVERRTNRYVCQIRDPNNKRKKIRVGSFTKVNLDDEYISYIVYFVEGYNFPIIWQLMSVDLLLSSHTTIFLH